MGNTHGIADFAHELQAVCADQLPACVISGGSPTVPTPPSLTLAAFATEAYVRETDTLVYADQEAHSVTVTGADGTYWLAISTDTWTSYAQWTTENGTKYRWRPNATQPADVAGLLVFASVTVSGGAITVVSPLATVTRAAAGRALLALGTMATQHANAVAIAGGSATGLTEVQSGMVTVSSGLAVAEAAQPARFLSTVRGIFRERLGVGNIEPTVMLEVNGDIFGHGTVGVQGAPQATAALLVNYRKATQYGMNLYPSDTDTGLPTLQFLNNAGSAVGSISTTATATAFNTSSDGRLKAALTPLADALATVAALRPVRFRWRATGTPGVGFVAQEVAPVVPEAVTGQAEAPEPMAMDLSKLVPYLVGSIQTLAQQVEALTARLAALEPAPAVDGATSA